jgi:hypothetical protein
MDETTQFERDAQAILAGRVPLFGEHRSRKGKFAVVLIDGNWPGSVAIGVFLSRGRIRITSASVDVPEESCSERQALLREFTDAVVPVLLDPEKLNTGSAVALATREQARPWLELALSARTSVVGDYPPPEVPAGVH